jgi:hypothetical protein
VHFALPQNHADLDCMSLWLRSTSTAQQKTAPKRAHKHRLRTHPQRSLPTIPFEFPLSNCPFACSTHFIHCSEHLMHTCIHWFTYTLTTHFPSEHLLLTYTHWSLTPLLHTFLLSVHTIPPSVHSNSTAKTIRNLCYSPHTPDPKCRIYNRT